MATPLNDRDVRLQAETTRFTPVTPPANGLNIFTVAVYQRAATNTCPSLPSALCTLTFSSGVVTGLNNGWALTVPATGGAFLFLSTVYVSSSATNADIPAASWGAGKLVAQDGGIGARGPGHFYATGTAWSDTVASAAATAPKQVNDVVTISGTGFAQTRTWSGSAWVQQSGTVDPTLLLAASLDATKFAASIEPVTMVSGTNPTVKSTSNIYNTTDQKLYNWNGSAYVATVAATDISGTLALSAIPNLSASKITSGQFSDAQIAGMAAAKLTTQIVGTQITDGSISTPKLAAGAVTANEIAAGAITTAKLLVGSAGAALNNDPGFTDRTAWINGTIMAIADGKVGNYAMHDTQSGATIGGAQRVPADMNKVYRVRAWARQASANGALYLGVICEDQTGANVSPAGGGTYWYTTSVTSASVGTGWTEFVGYLNAPGGSSLLQMGQACKTMRPVALINYGSTTGYMDVQDMRIEEVLGATLIQDGAITTNKVAANAITANQIAANAITAGKMLITSKGQAINSDPQLEDISNAWVLTNGMTIGYYTTATGSSGATYLNGQATRDATAITAQAFSLDPEKVYKLSAKIYNSSGNSNCYVFVNFYDVNGAKIDTGWGGVMSGYVYAAVPPNDLTFRECGGQFGPSTGRAIPPSAKTCKIGVWLQYSGNGTGAGQQAAQDIRLERVNDASLIVDGAIIASKLAVDSVIAGKIGAGAISAREISAGSIRAKHLTLMNSDAVDPDPGFYDPSFWTGSDTWPSGVSGSGDASWLVSRGLFFNGGHTPINGASKPFTIDKTGMYRMRVSIYKYGGTTGNFTLALHQPGFMHNTMSIPRNGSNGAWAGAQDLNWGAIPDGTWTSYESTINSGPQTQDWLQYMMYGQITAGGLIVAFQLTRMGDASLIVDGEITTNKIRVGAVTADRIAVTNLAAINAELGSAMISTTGSLRSGQTAYDTGTGWWQGFVAGVPKWSIGVGGTATSLKWDGTNLSVGSQVLIGTTAAGTLVSQAAGAAATTTAVNNVPTISSVNPINYSMVYSAGASKPIVTITNSTSNGSGPYKYTYVLQYGDFSDINISLTRSSTGGNTDNVCAVRGLAFSDGTQSNGTITITSTDSLGRSSSTVVSFTVYS